MTEQIIASHAKLTVKQDDPDIVECIALARFRIDSGDHSKLQRTGTYRGIKAIIVKNEGLTIVTAQDTSTYPWQEVNAQYYQVGRNYGVAAPTAPVQGETHLSINVPGRSYNLVLNSAMANWRFTNQSKLLPTLARHTTVQETKPRPIVKYANPAIVGAVAALILVLLAAYLLT